MKQKTDRLIISWAQSVPDKSFLGMNVCPPARQRHCQCQLNHHTEHSGAFLHHSDEAEDIQESAFGQYVNHDRLPFTKIADSN